jgi:hypothetical protein
MNGAPSLGQAQRGVNGHKLRPCAPNHFENLVIGKRNTGGGREATEQAQPSRPARRTSEIDTENDR